MSKERITYAFVTLFILISLGLSVFYLFKQSLRLDEAQSLWVATKSIPAILEYVSKDVHVPLYFIILHFWIQVFGLNITAARVLSLVFFIASLPVLYLTARRVTNKYVSVLSIALYSLSPFIIWYSFEARMYTLLIFAAVLSHYFFLKMLKNNGLKGEVGYCLSTLLGMYTHYFFIFLVLSQLIFLLIVLYKRYKNINIIYFENNERLNILKRFFVPVFLAFLLFLPWGLYFLTQGGASNTQPLIPEPGVYNLLQTVINFLFGFQTTPIESILISLWPLSVIPIFIFFSKRKEIIPFYNVSYFVISTLFPILFVFAFSFIKPIFLIRYLIFTTPSFFILLAWILFYASKQVSKILLSLFIFMMCIFLLFQNISNSTPIKEDYEHVSDYLNSKVSSDDIILISAPFTIYPIEYYYKGQAYIETIPLWDIYKPGSIQKFTIQNLQRQLSRDSKIYKSMFVVLSYDQGFQKELELYLDKHFKRLQLKKFSPGLELRIYQLRY